MKLKQLLFFVAAFMMATSVFAADCTWIGASGGNFMTASNWDNAPTFNSNVSTDNFIINNFSGTIIYAPTSNQTITSLTINGNSSVNLWGNLTNTGSARTLTMNATSNALNIGANCTLDLGKNNFAFATSSASFTQNTTSYIALSPSATMNAVNANIKVGQFAVVPGILAKGAKVSTIDGTAITFDKNFLTGSGAVQVFFFPEVCTGTGTLRLNGTSPTSSYYYPFTVEFYNTAAHTVSPGYYKNLIVSGNKNTAAVTINNSILIENLDLSNATNCTYAGNAQFFFVGSAPQVFPAMTTTNFSVTVDNPAGLTLSGNTTISNNLKLYNGSKLTIGDYNLTLSTTTTTNIVTSTTSYIVTNGTGAVSRTWAANKNALTIYIGASATSSDPVTITPGANSMTFSARVGSTLSGNAAPGIAYNAKEWVITPSAAGAATIAMSPSVSTFINTHIIGNWNGSSYTDASATLTGTADPYSYSASLSLAASANKLVTGGNGVITTGGNISALSLDANKGVFVSSGELTVDATTSTNKITVAPGAKLTLDAALTSTNGIVLQSDATGTATIKGSGTLTGTVTAQQYLGSARNWYVSSPITTATAPAANITRYYEYVEAGNNADLTVTGSTAYWKGLNTGTGMTVGKGYIAQAVGLTTATFSGTPNNGDITTSFNLTRDDAKGKGFNLVGNPYPSYLDWADVATANPNLSKTFYFRSKNSNVTSGYTFVTYNGLTNEYVSSNGTANTSITRYIPPTQAFWVRVNSGTSTTQMNFTNAMREHRDDNGNLMKAPAMNGNAKLRLQLLNGNESDETLIYFDSNATNGFNEYDSPKMFNNSSIVPDLYTKTGNEKLVINGLNTITENMELPLGFSLNSAASLKLKATELSNLPEATRVFLLDKSETRETELTPETEYNFSTTEATVNNESRFALIFRAPGTTTGVDNTAKLNAQVFVNENNQISIIAPEKSNYAIYNAVGQLMENGAITSNSQTSNFKHAVGVYIVKVGSYSTRVIVK